MKANIENQSIIYSFWIKKSWNAEISKEIDTIEDKQLIFSNYK
jgi:hypothetical protein